MRPTKYLGGSFTDAVFIQAYQKNMGHVQFCDHSIHYHYNIKYFCVR